MGKENCVANIDFMWLDLQGMELMGLKSEVKILKSIKPIYTDVSRIEEYEGQTLYSDLKGWFFQMDSILSGKKLRDVGEM